MPRPKGSKNLPRVSLAPLDFADALEAVAATGPAPAEPVEAERRAAKKPGKKKRPAK